MNKIGFVILILLSVNQANAAANFRCYSTPGTPPQVFEYATIRCGPAVMTGAQIGKDGQKDVLCVHQAICQPAPENEKNDPPQRSIMQLTEMVTRGELKYSTLICKGTGLFTNGQLVGSQCPPPNACRRDVFYNYGLGPVTIGDPVGISAGGTLPAEGTQ